MRIGVDIDGVLADIAGGTLRIINNMYGTDYTLSDWDNWNFAVDIFGDAKLMLQSMEKAWELGYVGPIEPNIGEIVDRMKELGVVTIISKRTYLSHPIVIKYLQEWKVKYDNIVLLSGDNGEEKLEYPIDVLIDDYPNINYFRGNSIRQPIPILLRDQPWNQNINEEFYWYVQRIYLLEESIPILERLKERDGS